MENVCSLTVIPVKCQNVTLTKLSSNTNTITYNCFQSPAPGQYFGKKFHTNHVELNGENRLMGIRMEDVEWGLGTPVMSLICYLILD